MESTFTQRSLYFLAGLAMIFFINYSCDTKETAAAYDGKSISKSHKDNKTESTKVDTKTVGSTKSTETGSIGSDEGATKSQDHTKTESGESTTKGETIVKQQKSELQKESQNVKDKTVELKEQAAELKDIEIKTVDKKIARVENKIVEVQEEIRVLESEVEDARSVNAEIVNSPISEVTVTTASNSTSNNSNQPNTYIPAGTNNSGGSGNYASGKKMKNKRGNLQRSTRYANSDVKKKEVPKVSKEEAERQKQFKVDKLEKKELSNSVDDIDEDKDGTEDSEETDDGLAGLATGLDKNVPDVATLYERYNPFNENDWIKAEDEATSTFSIDVDNASYTNFRRYINQNQLPPKDAIRMEEWLNFFNYDLEGPEEGSEHPLNITSEIGECPWSPGDELVMIKMQAEVSQEEDLPPSNLVFLVDVSGSMNRPNKLPLVQESMIKLVDKLRPEDRLSIVTYAGSSKTMLEPTSGAEKEKIKNAINGLKSGGGTAGSKGIETAYQLAADNFDANGNNRVILATDGDWNVGITDRNELKKLIEKKRESGIFLSVLGFGMGNLNDAMMETIADNGNGNYAYVDSEKEAERLFNYEFSGTMHVIAKDVKLQLVFDEAEVESYRLLGYENRVLENWMFSDDKIDAGDLGIGQNVVAFYQIKRKSGSRGKLGKVDFRYKPLGSDVSTLLTHDFGSRTKELSSDFKFASCVAEFALCLRESEYRGSGTMEAAILRGKQNLGESSSGLSYEKRVEFVGLLDPVSDMWEDYVLETAPDITEKETELKLYPNPARDFTTVEVPERISEKWSIQIYDMKGGLQRVVHFNQQTQGRMEVGDLTRGTYILKIYSGGNNYGYLRLVKS